MIKRILFFSFCLLVASSAIAQNSMNNWYLSVGTHATNFGRFDEVTNGDYWDFQGFPTDISFGRSVNEALSVNFVGSLGELNGTPELPELNGELFWETNLQARLRLANGSILAEDARLDPYIFAGVGANNFSDNTGLVVPIGLGFNLWFTQNIGLNVNMGYDLTPSSENYLHASAGLAFRWGANNADIPDKVKSMGKIDPTLDTDNDGIADVDDMCPTTPGVKSNSGCPAMKFEDMDLVDLELVKYASQIYFENESAKIKKESYDKLDAIVTIMKKYPKAQFRIEGHASAPGTNEFNMDLSVDRAKSVKKYLTKKGVNQYKLWAVAYGENDPIATNKTEAGEAMNRRVEIHMVREDK